MTRCSFSGPELIPTAATCPCNRTSNSRSRAFHAQICRIHSSLRSLHLRTCSCGLIVGGERTSGERALRRLAQDVRSSSSTRHTASSAPGNRAIRTIRLVPRQTPQPICFPSWPDWALSNLNYLSTIPASRTARSCGPIRPGRRCSFRRSPRRTDWRMQHCKDPAPIPMRYSSSL